MEKDVIIALLVIGLAILAFPATYLVVKDWVKYTRFKNSLIPAIATGVVGGYWIFIFLSAPRPIPLIFMGY